MLPQSPFEPSSSRPPYAFPGNGWDGADDCSNHALNASMAAHHAEVAAKHAASLAQWVQYLWATLVQLQNKVTELEDWKRRALEDVRKLRDEHKLLKKKVLEETGVAAGNDETPASVQVSKLKSMSLPPGSPLSSPSASLSSQHLSPSAFGFTPLGFPPGFAAPGLKDGDSEEETATKIVWMPRKQDSVASITSDMSAGELDANHHEGVQVSVVTVDGVQYERAEWRIGQLSAKLRGCMGRALVSSPFSTVSLQDIRFMVCADGKDAAKGPRSRRQKELYIKKVTEGPLDGCLKLKISSNPSNVELTYYLKVGNQRRGPFQHNFSESTVCGFDDFCIDWLKQLEHDNSLVVSVEILKEPQVLPS